MFQIPVSVENAPYTGSDFQRIFDAWLTLIFATISFNRSMGCDEIYPFVISPAVFTKLGFILEICRKPADSNRRSLSVVEY